MLNLGGAELWLLPPGNAVETTCADAIRAMNALHLLPLLLSRNYRDGSYCGARLLP